MTGASGAGFSANLQPVSPAWAVYTEDSKHGYIRAFVDSEGMTLHFVESSSRKVLDSVTITNKYADIETDEEADEELAEE